MITKSVQQNDVISISNVAYISESFSNENLTARCVCPKSCDITHYRVSTSYASANQKRDSGFGMSGEFRRKLKTSLERSIDTREWVVPKNRRNNIEQTKAINDTYMLDDDSTLLAILHEIRNNSYIKKFEKSYTFVLKMGFEKIESVFKKKFKAVWDNIKFDTCIFEVQYLTHISGVVLEYKSRQFHLLIRFDEVQRAYRDVVPLLNFQATPEGRYDSIYLPRTLFNQSEETHETSSRIRRHIETLHNTLQHSFYDTVFSDISVSDGDDYDIHITRMLFEVPFTLNTTIEDLSNYTRSSNTTTAFLLDLKL